MCVYNQNIIGFAGRMNSGKTELAKVCEQFGYQRLYFALPLKELCAKLIGVTIDELNQLKRNETPINFTLDEKACETISKDTLIPYHLVCEKALRRPIIDVRELLQFVGTDLIREYEPDWHVNRVISMIEPDKKYVIDDVRFINEFKALMKIGAVTWFIIRPDITQVSNHISERQLLWQMFDNKFIVNDSSLEYFTTRWKLFMKDYGRNIDFRDEIISFLQRKNKRKSGSDIIMANNDFFDYEFEDYSNVNREDITQDDDGIIRIKDKVILNVFNIEDLKRFI